MAQRDPRIDPQPGDVTRGGNCRYVVLAREPESMGGGVRFFETPSNRIASFSIADWRLSSLTDDVIAVEGYSVASDAFVPWVSE